jgi:hypothetical protein
MWSRFDDSLWFDESRWEDVNMGQSETPPLVEEYGHEYVHRLDPCDFDGGAGTAWEWHVF